MNRILFEKIRNQFWTWPAIIILALLGLLLGALQMPNYKADNWILGLLFQGASTSGSRLILSSIATATMTVIGVVFSLTIVVLQSAASQYSPRVIETFIRSYVSQAVFGFFIGTFAYSLLLLRQIHDIPHDPQLPQLAISIAIVLVLICVVLLVVYINHLSHAIQSTTIITRIEESTLEYFEAYQKELEDLRSPHRQNLPPSKIPKEALVPSPATGYFQSLDFDKIRKCLSSCSWELRLQASTGDYIEKQSLLAYVSSDQVVSPEQIQKLQSAFTIGQVRTHSQDARYGVRQLADIALRALSPGINDPTTALESINRIGTLLRCFSMQKSNAHDIEIQPQGRILFKELPFREYLDLAFREIVTFSSQYPRIQNRIREILFSISTISQVAEHRKQSLEWLQSVNFV